MLCFFHLILFNLNQFNLIGFFVVSHNEKEKDVLSFQKSKARIISRRNVRVSISRQFVINGNQPISRALYSRN